MDQVERADALPVRGEIDVVLVRQTVRTWSVQQGFTLVDQTKMVTAASEIARNTVLYGRGGTVRIEALVDGVRKGLRLVFEDQGPGIPDVDLAMRDGHSTSGTRGEGLGAVQRQAHEFDAFSGSGGSVIVARVWGGGPRRDGVAVGAVSLPLPGEGQCGDAWAVQPSTSSIRLLVVDGLGHGPIAARAASVAVEAFAATDRLPGPEAVVHALHAALRPTRGAALA